MQMHSDDKLPGMTVRNQNIPEELGTIDYLLSDKTGTLTQNEMIFKKLRTGAGEYSSEQMQIISHYVSVGIPILLGNFFLFFKMWF